MIETDPSSVLVSFYGVTRSYDGKTKVVDDLDLEIRKGEFLTLLGPSGSGKTTSLMMLAGFEQPDQGHIYLNGKPIDGLPPEARDIGVVFQNYALFPHMTVAQNVGFPLRVRGLAKAEIDRRVRDALKIVRLEDFADRRPTELSGGQQQRVALTRALVFEPQLVLMDEPLGALDKQLREQLQLEIKHIQKRLGLTILYVTHDQSEALTMSDRIAVFGAGRIQQLGHPRDIYDHPANAFVATFIGDNNLMPATVHEVRGERAAVRLGNGALIETSRSSHAHAGAPVTVAIRPERFVIDPSGPVAGTLAAKVSEIIYVGDQTRVVARLEDGHEVEVRLANGRRAADPLEGATVTLGWHEGDAILLDRAA
ncbi:ABC transporter ATP-binding protein [Arboricoccus pini]|uniref:ABC transporter ATP-binding protein n=1 Tax=Arboricoccus pini TaxID=1963835 RepID=UPI002AC86237|nr:ABC transporter ATP-binding protein [Arboricoccus pini]